MTCHVTAGNPQEYITFPVNYRLLEIQVFFQWARAWFNNKEYVHSKATLVQLTLFLDQKGFLRCEGRIYNAPLTEDT